MVKQQVDWFKKHRSVLEGDVIHLRRPDGKDLDYWLNVQPQGKEKGLLMVFNPLNKTVKKKLKIPLYYTGLTDQVTVEIQGQQPTERQLDRQYQLDLEIIVPGGGYRWVSFR